MDEMIYGTFAELHNLGYDVTEIDEVVAEINAAFEELKEQEV